MAWANMDYTSHQRVNEGSQSLLHTLINLGVEFKPNDFTDINKSFRGGYWFGQSYNGKTTGEGFYSSACGSNPNISAATSFELFVGRKPFILDNHRLHQQSRLTYKQLYVDVTGFDDEKGIITMVGYSDKSEKKGRKLFKFTNAEFLIARKEMKIY